MLDNIKKYQQGSSGPYTQDYHALLGRAPWIFARRLLPRPPQADGSASLRPFVLSEGDVATVFSQFGAVEEVRFLRHRKTGAFLGTAFVRFTDYRSGIAAADAMNSSTETDELCVLYPGVPDAPGILVDRCEEAEVPEVDSPERYEEWLQRCETSPINYFW